MIYEINVIFLTSWLMQVKKYKWEYSTGQKQCALIFLVLLAITHFFLISK